eukprot:bmy_08721T0
MEMTIPFAQQNRNCEHCFKAKGAFCSSGKAYQHPVAAAFEQRGLASKAAELETELNEHCLGIDTLKEVDETCKCYRMEQIQKIIETLTQRFLAKGKELNEFREKHNMRLMGEDKTPAAKENSEGVGAEASPAAVLVS